MTMMMVTMKMRMRSPTSPARTSSVTPNKHSPSPTSFLIRVEQIVRLILDLILLSPAQMKKTRMQHASFDAPK